MTECEISNGIERMIDTSPFQHCECQRMGNHYEICQSALSLEEQGKKVTLSPRPVDGKSVYCNQWNAVKAAAGKAGESARHKGERDFTVRTQ